MGEAMETAFQFARDLAGAAYYDREAKAEAEAEQRQELLGSLELRMIRSFEDKAPDTPLITPAYGTRKTCPAHDLLGDWLGCDDRQGTRMKRLFSLLGQAMSSSDTALRLQAQAFVAAVATSYGEEHVDDLISGEGE